MASAWSAAFGAAWGNSWGTIAGATGGKSKKAKEWQRLDAPKNKGSLAPSFEEPIKKAVKPQRPEVQAAEYSHKASDFVAPAKKYISGVQAIDVAELIGNIDHLAMSAEMYAQAVYLAQTQAEFAAIQADDEEVFTLLALLEVI